MAAVGVDLALDRVDVADRGVVEMAAPQERLQRAQEAGAGRLVAGDDAGLDQRRALPVLAVALVVLLGILDRQRQRMAGRMGAQPQIGAEDVAIARAVLEQVDQRAGEAHGERHRPLAAAIGHALGLEQHDQVDVARVVELEGAELAHAEDHDAAGAERLVRRVGRDLATLGRLAQRELERARDGEIGEAGERRGDLLERPQAGDVGERGEQREPAPAAAEQRHDPGAARLGLGGDAGHHRLAGGIRPLAQQRAQDVGLGEQRLAEEGTVAEHRGEQRLRLDRSAGRVEAGQRVGQARPAREPALGGRRIAGPRQSVRREMRGARNHIPSLPVLGHTVESWLGQSDTLIRRIAHWLFRLLALLAAGIFVVAALVTARLTVGPLYLSWLAPYVERALASADRPFRVAVGGAQLRLGDDYAIELVGIDLRVTRPDGELLLELPEIEVGISLRALLRHGMLAPTTLAATAPRLVLARTADGAIRLRGLPREDAPEPRAALAVEELLAPLLSSDPKEPLSYLRRLQISGGRLVLEDQVTDHTIFAQDAELSVWRLVDGLAARLAFDLGQAGEPATVLAEGGLEAATGRVSFAVGFAGLEVAELVQIDPALPLEGIDLALSGRLNGQGVLHGAMAPLRFEIRTGSGTIERPALLAGPLRIGSATVSGELAADLAGVTIRQARLVDGDTTLGLRGEASWREPGLAISAEVEARNVARARPRGLLAAGSRPRGAPMGGREHHRRHGPRGAGDDPHRAGRLSSSTRCPRRSSPAASPSTS